MSHILTNFDKTPNGFHSVRGKNSYQDLSLDYVPQTLQDRSHIKLTELYPDTWRQYKNKVIKLTRNQPLHLLPDHHLVKWREYEVDHIVSITDGFKHGIPVEWISELSNLRVISHRDNSLKNSKSLPDHLERMLSCLKRTQDLPNKQNVLL